METEIKVQSVGIVGLGSFGAFLATLLPDNVRIIGYDADPNNCAPVEHVELAELSLADVIIIATPLDTLPKILTEILEFLRPETLVIDVCSVKVKPSQIYSKLLPDHSNLLLTHPLFGPQSAASGTNNHQLIVTKSAGEKAQQVVAFCEQQLGLRVTHMSAEAHDKIMARVHALTFFVARGLSAMDLKDEAFMTPSYKILMDLVKLDHSHSEQLFQTVQYGNPYAKQARKELLESFADVEASIAL